MRAQRKTIQKILKKNTVGSEGGYLGVSGGTSRKIRESTGGGLSCCS